MKQRYEELRTSVSEHPLFHNMNYFAVTITILKTTCQSIITKYLLPFIPEKKYNLDDFIDVTENNYKLLHKDTR